MRSYCGITTAGERNGCRSHRPRRCHAPGPARRADITTMSAIAAATVSVMLGARVVRMHNVTAAVDAMRMVEAIMGWRVPVRAEHNLAEEAR